MPRDDAYYRYLLYRRRRRNGHGTPRWLIAAGLLSALFVIMGGVVAGVGYGVYQSYADDLIPPDQAIAQLPRGGARIYDRDGKLLWEVLNPSGGRYEPVGLDKVSWYLINATVATEDASYWDNPGVNYKGLLRAGWENFSPFGEDDILEGTGGSSITQQLVKNIYFPPEKRTERSLKRKFEEVVLALELTREYPGVEGKRKILAWYLNQISFGSIYTGVEAASQGYFNKAAKDLTLAEAATLAGIPACPSCYDPIDNPAGAVERRNYVLGRMKEEGMITPEDTWIAAAQPLVTDPQPVPVDAPHFVFTYILPELEALFGKEAVEQSGLVVTTTLDLDLQKKAQQMLNEQIDTYESSCNCHNGSVVAIDPQTAELLVMVGSRDYNREDIQGQNNNALAENSPGSSFKPFTYTTAMQLLGWGPGTMILDTPLPPGYWDGKNPPRNPRGDYKGPITVRNALGNSLNIPAIKTLLYTSPQEDERAVVAQGKKMGITTLDRDLGPSMTVGGVDVKLLDMVYGYTVFPNLGLLKGVPTTLELPEGNRSLDPVSILKVTDRDGNVLYPLENGKPIVDRPFIQEERVAGEAEAFMITDILSDGNARCSTFGCGGLSIDRPMAIKTGTSEPFEDIRAIGDTWALAYTQEMVVGSWAGNSDNDPMTGISAASIPITTVREFLAEYHKGEPPLQFTRPAGLVKASACIPSGLKPTSTCPRRTPEDWFAEASAPKRDDDWWKVSGGRRTLVLPGDLSPFARIQAQQWGQSIGSTVNVGDRGNDGDVALAISSPAANATVTGVQIIGGRAASPGFLSYRIEYETELNPGSWTLIGNSANPVPEGPLAIWDTSPLPPGRYTLRLTLFDGERGDFTTTVTVQVGPPPPPVEPPIEPPVEIPPPEP